MSDLAPPEPRKHDKEDPGAQDLTESSDDHFSDASEGQRRSRSMTSSSASIPVTRVELVDDIPSYGEVPGTPAYKLRTQDAVPDEREIVPEGSRSRSASRVSEMDRPFTPGGTAIPKTVVEKIDPDVPSHGEVPGTAAYEMRKADADPDEIIQSPTKVRQPSLGEPTTHRSDSRSPAHDESEPVRTLEGDVDRPPDVENLDDPQHDQQGGPEADDENGDDGFGDDFDDFEEGEEVEGDDFDDFGEAAVPSPIPTPALPQTPLAGLLAGLPTISFESSHSVEEVDALIAPYLQQLFPDVDIETITGDTTMDAPASLLSDRSSSLWSQLVAPPPLQPPNWIKSRIRRLFLVSLGVPVDLDEILPASKQKKLILPSININGDSPRVSSQLARAMRGNASSTSVGTTDSKTGEPKKDRKKRGPPERAGPPPPPSFDANAATLICSTTEAAMVGFSDAELKEHVSKLETSVSEANSVLEYWLRRKDSALGDKEAFEGVIENLVGFVAKSKAPKSKSKR